MGRCGRGLKTRRGGFTLLEIVVALAILAVSLATLLSTMNHAIHGVTSSSQLTRAVGLAREEMERYHWELASGISMSEIELENGSDNKKEELEDSELRVEKEMEVTAIPGAYELIVSVYQGEEEDAWLLFELRQYVVIGKEPAQSPRG
ncbi:MAG: type II secretion system GspH family protein [Nitrospinota bacterium]|nr:type II secretion system GspH family protein [Nitrospinota bacterium]